MGNFDSHQRQKRGPSNAPTFSHTWQTRPFAPASNDHAGVVQNARHNYSFAQIPTSSLHLADTHEVEHTPNQTGMPDGLKAGIESLSGIAMDDVQVHYNSSQPANVQALAYTQGTEIHVGPGQEKHLPHEAWHVVQQKQGRVQPTIHVGDAAINDDQRLEKEADVMGARATSVQTTNLLPASVSHEKDRLDDQSPTQLTAIMQLYTTAGTQKTSQTSQYVVDSAHESILYVDAAAPDPEPANLITANGNQTVIGVTTYDEYHYSGTNFTNDCLGFAENLARGTDVDSARAEFRAEGDNPGGTERLFGHTDSTNVDIATGDWAKDNSTNPDVQEAYAITRTVMPTTGETPYHVAAVVAKDGSDNITLEADASDPTRVTPVFDMYDTASTGTRVPNSLSFHEVYETGYTSKRKKNKKSTKYGPSTGVLTPRTD